MYAYQLGGVRVSFRGCIIIVDHNNIAIKYNTRLRIAMLTILVGD